MRTTALAMLPALALAACGDAGTPPVDEGATAQLPLVQPLRPGEWELDETVGEVDQATMRAAEEAAIEEDPATQGSARTVCLPADYADRPPPAFWAEHETPCEYRAWQLADGRLEASLVCNATPGTLTIALEGELSDTAFDLATTATRSGTGSDDVTVHGRTRGRWLGPCDGD